MKNPKYFAPATTFLKRNSEKNIQSWIVAVDIGYSTVKVMSPTITASFPSLAIKISHDEETSGDVPESHIVYSDLDTKEKWIIGKSALDTIADKGTSMSKEISFGKKRYKDPMFIVLVRSALAVGLSRGRSLSPDGKDILIQTGNPIEDLSNADLLRKAFTGHHRFSLKIGNYKEQIFDIRILPENVYSMPQIKGTLFSATIGNPDPTLHTAIKKNLIALDGGSHGLSVFEMREGAESLPSWNYYRDLGMRRILEETATEFKKNFHINVNDFDLQKCMESGIVCLHKKNIQTAIPIRVPLNHAMNRVFTDAFKKLPPLDEYDYLIVAGGMGDAWRDLIYEAVKDIPSLKLLDGDGKTGLPLAFANVRGFYHYRLWKVTKAHNG